MAASPTRFHLTLSTTNAAKLGPRLAAVLVEVGHLYEVRAGATDEDGRLLTIVAAPREGQTEAQLRERVRQLLADWMQEDGVPAQDEADKGPAPAAAPADAPASP